MDHLMREKEAHFRRSQNQVSPVLWLSFDHDKNEHALTKFGSYPICRGWTLEQLNDLKAGKLPSKDFKACVSMIQSWFFLGFLEAAYQTRFRTLDYVSQERINSDTCLVVRTTKLRPFLDDFCASVRLDQESLRAYLQRAINCLSDLHGYYWALREHSHQCPVLFNSVEFQSAMRLAVIVAETVWLNCFYLAEPLELWPPNMNWFHTIANQRVVEERLEDRGWCASLSDLFQFGGVCFTEYASLLEPTDRRPERHHECRIGEKCIAINVDTTKPKAKHVKGKCSREFIKPSLARVLEILDEGTYPLIDLEALLVSRNTDSVKVKPREKGTRYVAFSHVWADGLQSNTETGLPLCQIERLREYARQVAETSLVWVDALCVPEEPTYKTKAILRMAEVYKMSSATVILDSGLESRVFGEHWISELFVRVLTSGWIHRLWTLPECVFSGDPYIAFKDAAFSLRNITNIATESRQHPIEARADQILGRLTKSAEGLNVGIVQLLLSRRDSSQLTDEPLAVAPMLGIGEAGMATLVERAGEDRVAQFWKLISKVPWNILFVSCPRLRKKNFIWAPQSLMAIRRSPSLDTWPSAQTSIVTDEGLHGRFLIYKLDFRINATDSKGRICMLDSQSKQTIGVTIIKSDFEETKEEVHEYDAVAGFARPNSKSERILGVTLLTQPPVNSKLPTFKYGRRVFLDLLLSTPETETSAFLCPNQSIDNYEVIIV